MKDIKKVTLIGLGAMGVFFAPRISEKLGADFRILADGARKERLERKGVTVNTINYRFPIITPDVEGDPADLVIIAVKGYDLELQVISLYRNDNEICRIPLDIRCDDRKTVIDRIDCYPFSLQTLFSCAVCKDPEISPQLF